MPCVVYLWMADDFEDIEDIDAELSPDEVTAAMEMADATLEADISLSWGFMRDCAKTVKSRREIE